MTISPCADDISVIDHQSVHLSSESHEHPENSEDGCTPFCICQCCGTSITLESIAHLDIIDFEFNEKLVFHYCSNYYFDYTKGLWHPPSQT